MRIRNGLAALLLLAAISFAACGGVGESNGEPGGVYIALGDSIAAGMGASSASETSYVALVGEDLRKRHDGMEVRNLAVSGDTTVDVLSKQLPQAEAAIEAGAVRAITLTIGGNDLGGFQMSVTCLLQGESDACPIGERLGGVESRLDDILATLRARAGDDALIVVTTYPNFFSMPGLPGANIAAEAIGRLNDVIREVAGRHGARVAELETAFDNRAQQLTNLLRADPHPNDAGYRVIAGAVIAELD